MRLNEISYSDTTPVEGYGPGFFRVGGQVIKGAILVLPKGVFPWGGYSEMQPILEAVEASDVLLVGTGAEISPLPVEFREPLEAAGLGVEVMASPTAARSFNMLLAEGRRVAAALMPV